MGEHSRTTGIEPGTLARERIPSFLPKSRRIAHLAREDMTTTVESQPIGPVLKVLHCCGVKEDPNQMGPLSGPGHSLWEPLAVDRKSPVR